MSCIHQNDVRDYIPKQRYVNSSTDRVFHSTSAALSTKVDCDVCMKIGTDVFLQDIKSQTLPFNAASPPP